MTDTGTPPGEQSGAGEGLSQPSGQPPATSGWGDPRDPGTPSSAGWGTTPPSWGAGPSGEAPSGAGGPAWGGRPAWGGGGPSWGGGPAWEAAQAPKPGVVPLRPLGFGEVLDGAFTTVQRYPKIMLGLSTAVMAVLTAVYFATMFVAFADIFTATSDTDITRISDATWAGFAVSVLALTLVSWVATVMLTGMITVTVSRGVLGRPASVGEVWRTSRPHLLRLLGLTFLIAAAYTVGIAVAILVVALGFYLNLAVGVLLAVVVGIGAVFVGVVAGTRTALASAVLVLETQPLDPALPSGEQRRVPVVAALRRSWHLVKGRTPRTLGILVVANLVASVVSSVIQTAFTLLATGIGVGVGDSFGGTEAVTLVVLGIGALASSVLQIAFLSAVNALVYVDARMRSEGLDITLAQVTGTGAGIEAPGSPWATR
ncbi:hypothetical protein [Actinopolymorpha pittospori]|uniref:Glycerophosphoryl diester phosphodiesterase membrane domain-containing protein n=1 Tax=Actinopolymorpha pittospori TaxID=648752 RepID=A0A927MYX2_9ACTN|nr:hypothetical protein [Actinopolymorpha pittospori]MBE1607838.1 hypothetical protein [Actinopolymorpha pittospori]